MKNNKKGVVVGFVVFMGILGLVGCNVWERDSQTPGAAIQGQADQLANYAQMQDGSTVVDG